MKPLPAPPSMEPSEFVSQTLRQCALILDPLTGRLTALEEEFGIHATTIRVWIRNGRIPHRPCLQLLKRFGKEWIDFDRLTGDA